MRGTLLDVDYITEENKSHPRLLFYNDEKFFHVVDKNFRPYFYVVIPGTDEKTIEETKHTIYSAIDSVRARVERQEIVDLNERGKPKKFSKVVCWSTFDVVKIRDEVKRRGFEVREADILYHLRYLVDKGLEPMSRYEITPGIEPTFVKLEGIDEPRVLALDIEAYSKNSFPQPKENPCIIITMSNGPNSENRFLFKATDDNNDKKLLEDFVDKFLEIDPHIVVGYNCVAKGTKIMLSDGNEVPIEEVRSGQQIIGIKNEMPVLGMVKRVWKTGLKPTLKVSGRLGRSNIRTEISCTRDHRVLVGDENSIAWKRASEIKDGDYLLMPRMLPSLDEVPNASDIMDKSNLKLSRTAILKWKKNLPYGTSAVYSKKWGVTNPSLWGTGCWSIDRCDEVSRDLSLDFPTDDYVLKHTNESTSFRLTPELLYKIGLIATDGSLRRVRNAGTFYNKNDQILEAFGGDIYVNTNGISCQRIPALLTLIANGLGIPRGDKTHTPMNLSKMFSMPEDFVAAFLAGTIDGDGHCSDCNINISNGNNETLRWYQKLFMRLGIVSSISDDNVIVTRSVASYGNLRTKVLPYMNHEKKRSVIERFSPSGKGTIDDIIPYCMVKNETTNLRLRNDYHKRGYPLRRWFATSANKNLWRDFVFVRVDSVVEGGYAECYDMETSCQSYMANGVVVHNCTNFDWPYLIERANAHGITLPLGVFGENVLIEEGYRGNNEVVIPGRTHVDLYQLANRDLKEVAASYGNLGLDNVAEFLKVMKRDERVNIEGSKIWEWWDTKREELLQYAMDDAVSTWGLANKLLPEQYYLSRLTHMPLGETAHANRGKMVEGYLMRAAILAGEVIGNKKQGSAGAETFEGAFVRDAPRGLLTDVCVADFSSLYPTIQIVHNIGPDTFVDASYTGEVWESPTLKHRFKKEPDGLFKAVLQNLIKKRKQMKAEMKKCEKGSPEHVLLDSGQQALKVLTNSNWGYIGWANSRFYVREVAESIPDYGRYYIGEINSLAEREFGKIFYNDTDSIFLPGEDVEKVEKFVELANSVFPVQMEIDKEFKTLFFYGKKKKYSGLTKDGKIESRGIEVRRGDWSQIAKSTQHQILDKILREKNPEAAAQVVKDTIKRLREGNYTRQEVTLWKSLTKDLDEYKVHQAHTKAIMKAMDENKGFQTPIGTKVGYVMLKHEGQGTGKKVKHCPIVVSTTFSTQDEWLETIDGYNDGLDQPEAEGPEIKCGRPLVAKSCPEHGEVVPKLTDKAKLVDFLEDDDVIDVEYYVERQILKPSLRILSVFDTEKGVPFDSDALLGRPVQMKLTLLDMYESDYGG